LLSLKVVLCGISPELNELRKIKLKNVIKVFMIKGFKIIYLN
jgi:hypothetical protein